MSGFFSDSGIKIFGQEDPTIKAIKDSASNGEHRGRDTIGTGGKFPAPLISSSALDGSLGDWMSSTPAYFLPYPNIEAMSGFTEPKKTAYEETNYDKNADKTTPDNLREQKLETYNNFEDYAGRQFTHLLDYFIDQKGQLGNKRPINTGDDNKGSTTVGNTKDIYLGSFIRTADDNEDPTMLGYDITIKYNESPLFNGTIDSFIEQFGKLGNSEISSRKDLLDNFKKQFAKFVKFDSPTTGNSPEFVNKSGVKVYYMKSLVGLNNLVESGDSQKIKSFVDYGVEFITLGFNEDVSQNLGYLSSLYKSLSWSRINGKQIIPENLLRFDVDITITEIRKFNRVVGNLQNPTDDAKQTSLDVYADLISKYTYTLYECQFFFSSLPHGDTLDMSAATTVEKYDIKFNYKYSTMKFSKFNPGDSDDTKSEYAIDNKHDNISRINPSDTTNSRVENNNIISLSNVETMKYLGLISENNTTKPDIKIGDLQSVKKSEDSKSKIKKSVDILKKDLTNDVVREANRRIIAQASLLNKTLDNIRNAIPGAGRMSAPTNVYDKYNTPFRNDVINSARGFVGNAVKGFFTNP